MHLIGEKITLNAMLFSLLPRCRNVIVEAIGESIGSRSSDAETPSVAFNTTPCPCMLSVKYPKPESVNYLELTPIA